MRRKISVSITGSPVLVLLGALALGVPITGVLAALAAFDVVDAAIPFLSGVITVGIVFLEILMGAVAVFWHDNEHAE